MFIAFISDKKKGETQAKKFRVFLFVTNFTPLIFGINSI